MSATAVEARAAGGAGEWPLVGRSGELRLLSGLLSRGDGQGIVIAGPAGVGKTRLATECLTQAERSGLATAHTTATRAASGLAFGAVAPLLPATETATGAADRSELLRRFAAALAERAGGRRIVYLVDDAHLLDDSSATLIYQLAATGAAIIVATVRPREQAPEPVVALWKDGLLDRLELGGLDGEAMEELLAHVLGGPVDGAAVARLAARCEGNVLFLKELVLGALASGALACDGGLWRLVGALAPSERLVELVETRLASLDDADRAMLEAVALGEPLGTAELAVVGDVNRAESLERQGLLQSELDGRRLRFRLAHPLHGEVLRGRISALRGRGLARVLAEALEATGAAREDDTLRVATWRLGVGGADPDVMLAAATTAVERRYDFPLAERLARAALDSGAGFPAAVMAAQLTSLSGRGAEAEAELAVLAEEAADDDARGLVAAMRLDNFRYLGRFDEALRVAREAAATLASPEWRDELTAKRAGLLLDTEGPAAATVVTETLRPQTSGRALVWVCLYSAFALGRVGQVEAAAAAATQGLEANAALTGRPLQWPPGVLRLARSEALVFAGRLEEAESLAADEYRQAVTDGSIDAQAYAAWQRAKILLAHGRVEAAARHGREAAALLRQLRRRVLLRDCLVPLAHAEALRGEPARAAAVLAELNGLNLPPSRWTGVDLLQARAWPAVAAGDLPAGRRFLEEAVGLGAEVGDKVGEAAALHDLARLGRARAVADRLSAVAAGIDGELAGARAAHAGALRRGDPDALGAVSTAFEGMGALLLAAEAAADAAVALRRRGDPRAAAVAERRAGGLADRCEGATTPALQAVETRSLLTPAEREVALLAVAGRSNKEIADRLGHSVRTVENRLHRIYEKLGVSGRAELGSVLEG
jgi:ATP/maltotriose-dependent transcriptional regulator MalT